MVGINGSNNSGSFNLHKKRRVEPLKYSFGCCKSLTIKNKKTIHFN